MLITGKIKNWFVSLKTFLKVIIIVLFIMTLPIMFWLWIPIIIIILSADTLILIIGKLFPVRESNNNSYRMTDNESFSNNEINPIKETSRGESNYKILRDELKSRHNKKSEERKVKQDEYRREQEIKENKRLSEERKKKQLIEDLESNKLNINPECELYNQYKEEKINYDLKCKENNEVLDKMNNKGLIFNLTKAVSNVKNNPNKINKLRDKLLNEGVCPECNGIGYYYPDKDDEVIDSYVSEGHSFEWVEAVTGSTTETKTYDYYDKENSVGGPKYNTGEMHSKTTDYIHHMKTYDILYRTFRRHYKCQYCGFEHEEEFSTKDEINVRVIR